MALPRDLERHRGRDQIVILQRALIVGRVDQLRRRFDADHQRRGALKQRHMRAARMQVLRDVVAAVAGADHDRAFALPVLAIVVLARVHHRAAKILQAGNLGHARNAADAGRQHDMARMHGTLAAVGAAQRHRPALFHLVIAAALELGLGPEVQLHALDVGFEPVGELVLRDVGRPVRREQHIGQVVDLHLVMQRQRMVALAPIVADALFAVDDQRIDVQLLQPRGDREPGLPAADDENSRIVFGIAGGVFAQVEPVGAAKIPRIGAATRACDAELLLKSLEFAELGQQRPRLELVAVVSIRDQPDDTAAASDPGLELEDRLDRVGAGPHHLARRRAVGIDGKAGGDSARGVKLQLLQDGIRAVDRSGCSSSAPAHRANSCRDGTASSARHGRIFSARLRTAPASCRQRPQYRPSCRACRVFSSSAVPAALSRLQAYTHSV